MEYMDDRKRLIAELEDRVRRNLDLRTEAYAVLGRHVAEAPQDRFPDGNVSALVREIIQARKTVESNAEKGKRIIEIVKRLDDIRTALRTLETESDRLEKENLPVYEKYGKTFSEQAEEPESLSPAAKAILLSIRELHKDILSADERVLSLKDAPGEKNFMEKLFQGGKVIFLNSSKTIKLRNLEKLFQNLGRVLLESEDSLPDDETLSPYSANRDKKRKNSEKAASFQKEQNLLESELGQLGVEKRYQKRLKDLQIQSDLIETRLTGLYTSLGTEVCGKSPAEEDARFSAVTAEIEDYGKRAAECVAEKAKLEAGLEYDGLTRKMHDLKRSLEAEEEEIREHRSRVESLNASLAEMEKEKRRLEKMRR